ncbi:hypothetical protein NKH92_30445 [Mesorhizobium sp. M0871]|uniref:hypothetical protein n=1 Tax=Mesorhizobium sp. M0871 TaxID=2957017 RepID=UPI0033385F7A
MIRLQQSKTGTRVVIPVGGPLKALRDKVGQILLNSDGVPWTSDGFHFFPRRSDGLENLLADGDVSRGVFIRKLDCFA